MDQSHILKSSFMIQNSLTQLTLTRFRFFLDGTPFYIYYLLRLLEHSRYHINIDRVTLIKLTMYIIIMQFVRNYLTADNNDFKSVISQ